MIELYLKYFKIQLASMLEYRKSFIISVISQVFSSGFSFLSIVFLFDKFGSIHEYTFRDVLICFAISFFGFSISECFFRGFDHFAKILANGEFDRILTRPRNLIIQVLGTKIEFQKIGKAITGFIALLMVLIFHRELLYLDKMITIFLMIIGTIVIYANLFILKASITFFTTQSLEIMNIFTDGGRDLAQYPLDIYKKWVLDFFTYILPMAFVNYYPLLYVIGKSNNLLYMISPFISFLFIIPCFLIWKIGVKRYKSIGS
ncbi:MAG: ABC-2 family transporter protein [Clostridia bacterium]|nr:ABC-2 family transporter protein [Clostridia bacterium]